MAGRKRKLDGLEASGSMALSPPAKKSRKKADPADGEGKPEKRLAKFKPKCPQNILERVDRVMSQRFFMIDRTRVGDQLRETFKVLGSTGNVYTVVIDKLPSCDCPDASKGNHCKHILFIYLKVLGVPNTSSSYYQKALITQELEEIFASAPAAPNSAATLQLRTAYAKATGSEVEEKDTATKDGRRIPEEDDDCPICYETMGGPIVDVKSLTFCDACGNALHTECFRQWSRTARELTCVWCRAKWIDKTASGSFAAATSEGYLNLGPAAGVSPERDTSSYYKGPRSGGSFYHGHRRRYY